MKVYNDRHIKGAYLLPLREDWETAAPKWPHSLPYKKSNYWPALEINFRSLERLS